MPYQLSDRVQSIQPSPTLAVSAKAAALRQQGLDIIGLGTGEPDFDTPSHIKQAAIKAIEAGQTKYTAVDGTPELKQAVREKFQRENHLSYQLDQILVSVGGKQSFFNLCQALLQPGDEVIIPAPYWVSYPDIVKLAGAKPVIIEANHDQAFKITPEQLAAHINKNTKLLVINSPSNPSGKTYSKAELAALGEILLQHPHVLIATDDMYEHIRWTDEPFVNIVNACPALFERTLVLNGVSKAFAMTGWRIGYAAGPQPVIAAMKKIQSQSTSNPTSVAQAAAVAALNGGLACVQPMVQAFKERHDMVVERLNQLPGVTCLPADGTFYVFPRVAGLIDQLPGIKHDGDLCQHLLTNAQVALVPGSAFGMPMHLRFSYATSPAILTLALERIAQVV